MAYTAVGFDYGGVLAHNGQRGFAYILAELLGVSHADVARVYFRHNLALNRDEITYEECWVRVLHDLGRDDMLAPMMDLLAERSKQEFLVVQPVVDLVRTIKENGYAIGLLTNNSAQIIPRLKQQGMYQLFDTVLVSGEIGLVKPEPSVFHLLSERLGVSPDELIFVDDTPRSLETADQVGYTPVLFTTYEQLVVDLSALGVPA